MCQLSIFVCLFWLRLENMTYIYTETGSQSNQKEKGKCVKTSLRICPHEILEYYMERGGAISSRKRGQHQGEAPPTMTLKVPESRTREVAP